MKKALIVFGVLAMLWSCTDEETPADPAPTADFCDSLNATYTKDIASILQSNCSPCHVAGSEAGYNFSNYTNSKSAAENSAFIGAIKHEGGFTPMPKGASMLSDGDIDKIECWISKGYPES